MRKRTIFLILCCCLTGCTTLKDYFTPEYVKKDRERANIAKQKLEEFNNSCSLYVNAAEPDAKYLQLMHKGPITWDGYIQAFQNWIDEESDGRAIVKNPTKNNKLLSFLIYNNNSIRKRGITDFLNNSKQYQDEECYKKLNAVLGKLKSVNQEIYHKFYTQEEKDFFKKTGFAGISNNREYIEALSVGQTSSTPDKNVIYKAGGFKVIQVLNDGILATSLAAIYNGYPGGVVYIKTAKNNTYVDGTETYDIALLFTGTKKYISTLGAYKTVYAFKEVDLDYYYKKYASNNYFFPVVGASEDFDTEKALVSLLDKK